jgi:mannitol-specific phosphotransferase system IIBC component
MATKRVHTARVNAQEPKSKIKVKISRKKFKIAVGVMSAAVAIIVCAVVINHTNEQRKIAIEAATEDLKEACNYDARDFSDSDCRNLQARYEKYNLVAEYCYYESNSYYLGKASGYALKVHDKNQDVEDCQSVSDYVSETERTEALTDRRLDEVVDACTDREYSQNCQDLLNRYDMSFWYCDSAFQPDYIYGVAIEGKSTSPDKNGVKGIGYKNCRTHQ